MYTKKFLFFTYLLPSFDTVVVTFLEFEDSCGMATTDKCQGIFPPEGSVNHFNHTLLEVIIELSVIYNSHDFSCRVYSSKV